MCGRFARTDSVADLVHEFDVADVGFDGPLAAAYNIAPSTSIVMVTDRPDRPEPDRPAGGVRRRLELARWGLVPSWAKDPKIGNRLVNARVETAPDKPAFRRAFASRRCLIPASGYYEWYEPTRPGGRKQPFYVTAPLDGDQSDARRPALAMAGLFDFWRDPARAADDPERWLVSAVVLTTDATDAAGYRHDRMPLLVPAAARSAWLDPVAADPGALRELLVPAAPGRLDAWPVSTAVNRATADGPELLEPVPAS